VGLRFWRNPVYFVLDAEVDDLAALAEIHEASFPHGWDAEELARMLGSPGVTALVARRRGGKPPLGFVLMRKAGGEAEIITLATDPARRGRGIGRTLMREAIRRLQHDRVARLFLEVSEKNAAALALYRSLGFRQVGRRQGYYTSHAQGGPSEGTTGGGRPSTPPAAPPAALVMELDLR